MVPTNIQAIIDQIKVQLQSHDEDTAMIAQLKSDKDTLTVQVTDLQQNLADTEAALQALVSQVPAPVDTSGSSSSDVTP